MWGLDSEVEEHDERCQWKADKHAQLERISKGQNHHEIIRLADKYQNIVEINTTRTGQNNETTLNDIIVLLEEYFFS